MAVGQVAGEIVRPENSHHAMRPVGQVQMPEIGWQAVLTCAISLGFDRDRNLGDHRVDFGARLLEQLAHVAADGERHRLFSEAQFFRIPHKNRLPGSLFCSPPCLESGAGGLHGLADLRARRGSANPDHLSVRRAGLLERGALSGHPFAIDEAIA